jgi:hypothetical protein
MSAPLPTPVESVVVAISEICSPELAGWSLGSPELAGWSLGSPELAGW